jgi:hypothetical protein
MWLQNISEEYFMKRFLLIVALPFLVSLVFGWGAFPIVCGLYFLTLLLSAFLRLFGIHLIPDSSWGPPPSSVCFSTNPSTGLPMIGSIDAGGNAFGAGHRNG